MRRELAHRAGTRVRLDAPGYSFHGALGTVAMDMATAASPCFVLRDGFPHRDRDALCTCASSEVAHVRDQAPNPAHAGDFSPFWWLGLP